MSTGRWKKKVAKGEDPESRGMNPVRLKTCVKLYQSEHGIDTLKGVAKALDVDYYTMYGHINYGTNVCFDYALTYAKAFGVSIDWLCGLSEIPVLSPSAAEAALYTHLSCALVEKLHADEELAEAIGYLIDGDFADRIKNLMERKT